MAELLEPVEGLEHKQVRSGNLGSIERDSGHASARDASGSAHARDLAAQLEADVIAGEFKSRTIPAGLAGEAPEAFKIDREHLRRQSIITPEAERTPNSESFRRIKRQVLAKVSRAGTGGRANLIMVTSALPGEGKTFCAVNLAISMAMEMDRTVLLVDADVAKPSVPKVLGIKATRGLLDVLLDRKIDLAEVLRKTDINKLTLLPAGTPNAHATELLASNAMGTLLGEIAERYADRVVIFDSPPLLAASEAGVLANRAGQIVMVVEAGKTSEAVLKAALGRIDTSNVTGLLLNKAEAPALRYDYGEYGNLAK